jgi:hypothetical protein
MNPERLARSVISVSCAATAGAFAAAAVGLFCMSGVFGGRILDGPGLVSSAVVFVVPGAIAGAALGWKWGRSIPLTGRPCDQEADYGEDPPCVPPPD